MSSFASRIRMGENGISEHSSTNSVMVDLFFQLVRDLPEDSIAAKISTILQAAKVEEDANAVADLFVLAFQTRDCRGGKGEKTLFYRFFLQLYEEYPETVLSLVKDIAFYGYGKDLIRIAEMCESLPCHGALLDKICSVYADQLRKDKVEVDSCRGTEKTPSISMLCKFAPREHCQFSTFRRRLVKELYGEEASSKKSYRQLVVELTAVLQVPEVLMCANRFDELNFHKVPSLCLNRHRKAFLNEKVESSYLLPEEEVTGNRLPKDEKRVACRNHLIGASAEGNVAGKVLQPHELVSKVGSTSGAESLVFDAQWNKIKEGVLEQMAKFSGVDQAVQPAPGSINLGKLVALVDVSGSMSGDPMEVAIALGILVSELSDPAFRDRFITFETTPKWVSLEGMTSLKEKVSATRRAPWGGSTNFEAAIGMILDTAIKVKLSPDEIPDLIVFSDMQFDTAGNYSETMHQTLVARFHEAGLQICGEPYRVPRIIYWNLRGDTRGFPVQKDTPNTQMLSGFSPSQLKLLFTGEPLETVVEEVQEDGTVVQTRRSITPAETLRKCLDDERYFPIREVLSASNEGLLSLYTFERPQEEVPAWGGEHEVEKIRSSNAILGVKRIKFGLKDGRNMAGGAKHRRQRK